MASSYTVGLCMMKGKLKKLNLPACLEDLCGRHGIKVVLIDPSRPLVEQGHFDIILQKILDFKALDQIEGTVCFTNVVNHFSSGRTPIILDPIEVALNLADREWTMNLARACCFTLNGINVFVPKFLSVVDKIDVTDFASRVDESQLVYPVVAKQQMAAGSRKAHKMALVFSKQHLLDVATPCLVQEFVNHGGIMYKIFVLGKRHYVVERPSVRNSLPGDKPTVKFLSLDISKLTSQSRLHSEEIATTTFRTSDEIATLLDNDVVIEFIKRLRSMHYEFNMVGIDVLVEEHTGNYGIVDINYFPGYDGVASHFAEDMTELIRQKCAQLDGVIHNGVQNGN